MPQFDFVDFSKIYLWLVMIFIYFYVFWGFYVIPQIFKSEIIKIYITRDSKYKNNNFIKKIPFYNLNV